MLTFYCLKQPLARIFQDINHILESLRTTIVRVGHMVGHHTGAILRHAVYLVLSLKAGSQVVQAADVAIIHTDDKVKVIEVRHTYRARQMRYMVSTAQCMRAHSWVGLLTLVIADESGRVYLNHLVQPLAPQHSAHNLLGRT